ncbi:hypothetical protein GUJ93_ZPchr0012g21285 [Zizania palustris]|uniref:Uncharacterized protein n=1 Tax=Zizania palustris TaxID=103762 RepID=A0A8J5WJR0_ZIZPA|nr:hypothetical protein GUJ93_ZPchr0012g21285 [Zizania palustris]
MRDCYVSPSSRRQRQAAIAWQKKTTHFLGSVRSPAIHCPETTAPASSSSRLTPPPPTGANFYQAMGCSSSLPANNAGGVGNINNENSATDSKNLRVKLV